MKEIGGRNAVVTGAGSGIGRSIALALAKAGANVVVSDIEADAAASVAHEVEQCGVRALPVKTDVSKIEQVQALADAAYNKLGTIEILVNNAGVTLRPFRASWDTSYEDFRWIMDVNFWGVLHGHHAFVPRMRKTPGEKHIVNTSSMASLIAIAGHCAYSASKSAVDGLSNAAREELKTQGIGLSILHPGPIRTRIVTSDRLRTDREQSQSCNVRPWSDYVEQVSNLIVDVADNVTEPPVDPDVASNPLGYITPKAVGAMVVAGILENKSHILTHPYSPELIRARSDAVVEGLPN